MRRGENLSNIIQENPFPHITSQPDLELHDNLSESVPCLQNALQKAMSIQYFAGSTDMDCIRGRLSRGFTESTGLPILSSEENHLLGPPSMLGLLKVRYGRAAGYWRRMTRNEWTSCRGAVASRSRVGC